MAVLTDTQRRNTWAALMREGTGTFSIAKPDLRDALNAVDDWVDANAASLNAAIPQPARGALTPAQKAQMLVFVVERRFRERT